MHNAITTEGKPMTDYELILHCEMSVLCRTLNTLRKTTCAKHHLMFITNRILQIEDTLKYIGEGEYETKQI
jgi:hypothetical protein